MSWLRNHMRHYVIPGIRTLARADGRTMFDRDIKPSDKIVRPSTKCTYLEAGLLLAVVSSVLKKSNPTREVAVGLCRQLGRGNDAEFVYECDLGGRGDYTGERVRKLGFGYQGVEGADVLHSFIQNSVKELKARTKKRATAIYPGRDVWCWEVMSRRQGMPSLYDSRVSRSVATSPDTLKKVIKDWRVPDWDKTVLFDTGHQGTVPRAIGEAAGVENPNVIMLSAIDNEFQIFRSHAKSRKKALACEYLAKYRKRCQARNGDPYQELAELEEFIKAALFTIWLWYHVSPAHLPAWQDQEVLKTKDGLRFAPSKGGGQFTFGNSGIVAPPSQNNSGVINIAANNWGVTSAATTTTGPIFVDTGTSATTAGNIGIWDTGTGSSWMIDATTGWIDPCPHGQWQKKKDVLGSTWDKKLARVHALDKMGATPVPQKPKNFVPAIDPNTFQMIDPVSGVVIETAMDAKALGMDPVEYEVWKARAEQQKKLAAAGNPSPKPTQDGFMPGQYPGPPVLIPGQPRAADGGAFKPNYPPGGFKGDPLVMYEPIPPGVQVDAKGNVVADNRPPPPPKGVTIVDHMAALDAQKQVTGKDIVAYETAKLQAATAQANKDAADKLADLKDKIPAIMAASNAPPGQLPEVSMGIEVDKKTGAVHKTVTYKSPLAPGQPKGVPLPGQVVTPTTSVKPVTDGSGKAIT